MEVAVARPNFQSANFEKHDPELSYDFTAAGSLAREKDQTQRSIENRYSTGERTDSMRG